MRVSKDKDPISLKQVTQVFFGSTQEYKYTDPQSLRDESRQDDPSGEAFSLSNLQSEPLKDWGQELFLLLEESVFCLVGDDQGRITNANSFARTLLGKGPADLRGIPWITLLSTESQRLFAESVFPRLVEAQVWKGELCLQLSQNSPRWLECTIRPKVGSGGPLTAWVVFGIDVTERVQRDRERQNLMILNAVQIAATSRIVALSEMAAGIAHEINNPLTIIQGRAFQLLDGVKAGKLDPQWLTMLASSLSNTAQRIAQITATMCSFVQDGLDASLQVADFRVILQDALPFFSARCATHGIKLTTALPDGSLTLECYPSEIAQLILCLVRNSFDAVARKSEAEILLLVQVSSDWMELIVEDNGPKVWEDLGTRLFDPLPKFDPVGKRTGLGLSIAKAIAERHSGSLAFEANHPRTRFSVKLPRSQNRS